MLARCKTAALQGLEARPVLVEVDLGLLVLVLLLQVVEELVD